jgi:hypothetical protein
MFVVNLLIQLVVMVIALVIAGLIVRWIVTHPAECKALIRRTKRFFVAPFIYIKAARAYLNWKRVGMGFSYSDCLSREWDGYEQKHYPDQPYYRL